MKKFIMFYGGLVAIFIIAGLLAIVQLAIHDSIKDDPKVATNVTCEVQGTISDSDKVFLKLDCQGHVAFLKDSKVVVSYLNNPRPLTCTVYKSGKAKCQLLEQ